MFSKTTTVGDRLIIDPRFNLEVEYGQSTIPGMSILMNAVHAMTDLAPEDFLEPIVPIAYSLDSFPEIVIAPQATAPGGAIQTRFIVWGLYKGTVALIQMKNPQTAVFTLKWEGVIVGHISVTGPRAQLAGPGSNSTESFLQRLGIRAKSKSDEMARNTRNATHASNHLPLTVSFITLWPALRGSDVLITLLYALAYAAQYPSSQKAEAFELRPPDAQDMYFGMIGSETTPFFQYCRVIEALGKIPQYMLYQGRFSGVMFKMVLGGVEVGQGQMFKER